MFCSEGFKEAAEKFAEEAGISLSNVDLTSLDERLRIRESIESGKIQEAINLINTKAPELLDQNRQLAFHLKVKFPNDKSMRKIFLLATTFN